MLTKIYLSRRQTKAMSSEYPIGDPTGGAAYREMRDPTTAAISAVANVGSSLIGANAASSSTDKQISASQDAIQQQYQAAQSAIANQQQVLDAQMRNADNVQRAQLQQQKDALDNQLRIATETRDAQLGVATQTRDQQLALSKDVLGQERGVYQPFTAAGLQGQDKLLNYLGIGPNTGAQGYGQYATAQFTPEAFLANQDPGYGFRMKEGLKAVDAQAAARGGLISGAALKASQRFGQDMASQEYQNAFNRYQTSRQNTLGSYQGLQGVGLQGAGGEANALGRYSTTGANALNNYSTQAIGAYGGYGNAAGNAYGAYGGQQNAATGAAGNQIYGAYGGYGNNVTGALTGFGNNQANLTTGMGQAAAAGSMGQANALAGGISGATNAYYQNQMLGLLRDKNSIANNAQLANQYESNNLFTPSGGGSIGMYSAIQDPYQ